ncbi:MAG: ATP-binding cassette domain-containing protein [Gammaproteobacteria bacterium]|nr:ATP-binding cassette domain-containing protein [Gammaproteobacteria bacterium]
MNASSPNILEAINISKRFGDLQALDNVSLKLRSGSFHALLGENGAGKSTLVKCIMGYYQPDEGEVLFGDRQQAITNPHDALLLGIGMVYQHFTLIPNMTVAENIILSRPRLPAFINWRQEMKQLRERMQNMPFQIPLEASITTLSAGEKQKVEIIKQLLLDTKVLILDEPTSVLTPTEADEVLGQIHQMTRTQGLSVLIITHKFREVMSYADEVTVLRKGKYAGAAKVSDVTPAILAEMMVGREVINEPLQRGTQTTQTPVLNISDLKVDDDSGVAMLKGLSLTINTGEIVGIAGVSGNGQRELVQVLAGQRTASAGKVTVHDETYTAQRKQMRRHKFHCLPEEPLRNACVANMSVADNIAFRRFDRPPFALHNWLLNRKAIREHARTLIARFNVKTPGPGNPIGNLSGGNVQRAVLARELADDVDVLVVANPCFGLDFGAVADIHRNIMAARNRGSAVLLISEDLDEILELSDRVYVISNGKLVYETTPAEADLMTIGKHMAGH